MTAKKPTKKAPAKRAVAKKGTKALNVASALQASLMGRFRMAQTAGIQFAGRRDIYTVAGYVKDQAVTFEHYWSMYRRGDIAPRIVDMAPKTTWRLPPEVVEDGHEDGTEFTEAFMSLQKRLNLFHYMMRTDLLSGIGRFGVLLIGTTGVTTAKDMALPLAELSRPEDVLYLQPYHEGDIAIEKWETDPSKPRYKQPLIYKLSSQNSDIPGFAKSTLSVHYTRLIHVAEDLLTDEVYGRPRLERCLNRLFDVEKISAGVGEAYWQHVVRILQAKIDPNAEITPEQLADLDEKLSEMVHDLRRQFWGQGVELDWKGTDVPPVKDIGDFYFSLIAGAAGIPKRILFGSELGELASSTDQQTWFGQISERQEQYAEPVLLRAFIDKMVEFGALPSPTSGEYQVKWPPLFEEDEGSIADTNLKKAQTAQALTPVGADPRALVEIDDDRNVHLLPQTPEEAEERDIGPLPAFGEEPGIQGGPPAGEDEEPDEKPKPDDKEDEEPEDEQPAE